MRVCEEQAQNVALLGAGLGLRSWLKVRGAPGKDACLVFTGSRFFWQVAQHISALTCHQSDLQHPGVHAHTQKPVYTHRLGAPEGLGEEVKNHSAIGKYKGIFFFFFFFFQIHRILTKREPNFF